MFTFDTFAWIALTLVCGIAAAVLIVSPTGALPL